MHISPGPLPGRGSYLHLSFWETSVIELYELILLIGIHSPVLGILLRLGCVPRPISGLPPVYGFPIPLSPLSVATRVVLVLLACPSHTPLFHRSSRDWCLSRATSGTRYRTVSPNGTTSMSQLFPVCLSYGVFLSVPGLNLDTAIADHRMSQGIIGSVASIFLFIFDWRSICSTLAWSRMVRPASSAVQLA